MDSKKSKTTLQSTGVDLSGVKTQVQNDIQKRQAKKISKEKVQEIIKDAPEGVSPSEIVTQLLDRWYTLEGLDVEAFKKAQWITNTQESTQPIVNTQESSVQDNIPEEVSSNGSALKWFLASAAEKTKSFFWWAKEWVDNALGWAISNLPEAAWNTWAFFIGKPVDFWLDKLGFDLPSLEEQFKADWIETKENFQQFFWTDPDSLMTSVWEFWSNVGLLFTPWGQTKLISSFPNSADKIKKLWSTLDNMAQKSPKAYKKIKDVLSSRWAKLAWQGAKETAKFDIVSEWEISPTSVVIWTVANPAIDKAGKVIKKIANKDITSNMMKVFKPTKKSGQTASAIKWDMAIIANSLKTYDKKPDNLESLYSDLASIQKWLYESKINPALQKATESWGKIKMSSIIDDILPKVWENKSIKWKNLSGSFWRWKEATQLNEIVENIRKMGDLDFLEAETLKQYTSALSISAKQNKGMLSSLQEDFVQKLNKQLGTVMDDSIEKITWEWIKQFKSEYGAIARHLDALNRRIINDSKLSGDTLFSGLGKISGIRDIVTWNVTQWLSTIFTWEILKLMKDPDEILKKVVRELYNEQKTWNTVSEWLIKLWKQVIWNPQLRGWLSSEAWQNLDDNQ